MNKDFTRTNKSRLKYKVDKISDLLSGDLDFHDLKSNYSSHNFHSFPAKFPPQLPQRFIMSLTKPKDIVCDPMMGSGTTILEAAFNGRRAIGFDIDPLALMITEVKTTFYSEKILIDNYNIIIDEVLRNLNKRPNFQKLLKKFDDDTIKFIKYWFYEDTIVELILLSEAILKISNQKIQTFFKVLFSAIIITKSGGVSLALDLAHTRPHKAKKIINYENDEVLFSIDRYSENPRNLLLTKKIKSPLNEFKKKFSQNITSVLKKKVEHVPKLIHGDAQNLLIKDNSVDLIVTSPPYAFNAIDYMRAHKFSLVWFGYSIDDLKIKRSTYIGGDSIKDASFESLPVFTTKFLDSFNKKYGKKSYALHRYFSEMKRALAEMHRILKPSKVAIVVVGNSNIQGNEIEVCKYLKDIGENLGFISPLIGVRKIDRNRRMLPTSHKKSVRSFMQKRMQEEFIIPFIKGK